MIRLLDGPLAPVLCASESEHMPCPGYLCPNEESCVLRELWIEVGDAVSSVLDGTTFADLAARRESQPREPLPAVDVYEQPPESRRRQWARRTPRLNRADDAAP